MSELLIKSKSWFLYWRIAIFKVANGTLKAGVMAYLAGTAAQKWTDLSGDAKATVILTAVVAMTTFIDGFLDNTMTNLRVGRLPEGGSDPFAFKKTDIKL